MTFPYLYDIAGDALEVLGLSSPIHQNCTSETRRILPPGKNVQKTAKRERLKYVYGPLPSLTWWDKSIFNTHQGFKLTFLPGWGRGHFFYASYEKLVKSGIFIRKALLDIRGGVETQ